MPFINLLESIVESVDDNLGGWVIIGYVATMGTLLGFTMHLVINGLIRLVTLI